MIIQLNFLDYTVFSLFQVLIDYTVFFALDSNEGRQCTQEAIDKQDLLHSTTTINKWIAKDYTKMMKPEVIGTVKFYCTHRNEDLNRIVGQFKGLRFKSQDAYYYIG